MFFKPHSLGDFLSAVALIVLFVVALKRGWLRPYLPGSRRGKLPGLGSRREPGKGGKQRFMSLRRIAEELFWSDPVRYRDWERLADDLWERVENELHEIHGELLEDYSHERGESSAYHRVKRQ